ncbi:NAD(P)H-dependent oxidoreductase [Paenibacillus marinisediminis]
MKVAVINTHPNPDSFTYAVREVVESALQEHGHDIQLRDLYTLMFNPVLTVEDFAASKSGNVPEDVRVEQEYVKWADCLIIIYPLWWGTLPALLKGYIDRVFAYGFAYSMDGDGIKKLLSGKKAILFTMMGNSEEHYQEVKMFEAMKKTVDEAIFEFVGIDVLEHKYFPSVTTVDDEARKKMLEEAKGIVAKLSS